MNKIQETESLQADASDNARLLEVAIAIASKKRTILFTTLIATLAAAIISFILPNVYKATAKMLPPMQSQSSAAAMLSQLTGASGIAAGMTGIKNPSEMYVAMLRSRTVADKLIQRFDLKQVYGTDSLQKTREKLEDATSISAGKDGLITIDVESQRQQLVAQLTNAYIDELIRLTRVLAVTEASQRRLFFEQQLELAKNNLANAEISLRKGLGERGMISVDNESRAMVETVGRLRAQISAKEIERNSMAAFVTPDNPEYKRVNQELSSARAQLAKLENGGATAGITAVGNHAGLENVKLLRDVKYYQMLFELLAKQYEAARLDEAKDASVVQVLDPAIEPEKKTKPFRALIVVLSAFAAFFAAVGWVIVLDAKQRMLSVPSSAARWTELVSMFRGKK